MTYSGTDARHQNSVSVLICTHPKGQRLWSCYSDERDAIFAILILKRYLVRNIVIVDFVFPIHHLFSAFEGISKFWDCLKILCDYFKAILPSSSWHHIPPLLFSALCRLRCWMNYEVIAPQRKRALSGLLARGCFPVCSRGALLCILGPSLCQHPLSVEVQKQAKERRLSQRHCQEGKESDGWMLN